MSQHEVQIADRPLRECNQDIRAGIQQGLPVIVTDTRSRHNLGIGYPLAHRFISTAVSAITVAVSTTAPTSRYRATPAGLPERQWPVAT